MSQSAWAAIIKFHVLGGLNYRHLFSHSVEGWKVKIKVQINSVPVEGSLLDFHLGALT